MTYREQHERTGSMGRCHGAAWAVRRVLLLGVAAAVLAGAAPDAARADEAAKLYTTLCASCHGVSGHGDGPAASALVPPPADLTKSTLNVAELMRVIDGRRTVRAHGSDTMPVWGRVFEQEMADSGRAHRDSLRQVQMLAEYVVHLEKK
jgi:mono/diheme cytochrome c family protein